MLFDISRSLLFLAFLFPILVGCEKMSSDELIARAEQAVFRNDYRAAVLDLKSVLQQDDSNAKARWLLGEAYLVLENGSSAEKEFRRARALGVGDDAVLPALAHALWLQRASDELLELQMDHELSSRSLGELHAFRALAHYQNDSREAMAKELASVPVSEKGVPIVRFAAAALSIAEADLDKALDDLRKLAEDEPQFARAWSLLGDVEGWHKNFEQAELAYTQAVQVRVVTAPLDLAKRGIARVALENLDGALQDAEMLERKASKLALGQYLAGLVRYRLGEPALANESLERAFNLDSQHVPTIFLLAITAAELGNTNRSRELADRAVNLDPNYIPARQLAAIWYLRDRDGENAETMIRPVVQRVPDDLTAKELLASSLMIQGKSGEAARILEEISTIEPNSPIAQLKAGVGLISSGQPAKGMESLSKALAFAPDDLFVNATLMAGHLHMQDNKAALRVAGDLVNRNPSNADALGLMAATQLAIGEQNKAIKNYEEILKLDPSNLKALQMLGKLALANGEHERVLSLTDAGLKIHKNDMQLLLLRSEAAIIVQDEELSELSLRQAIDAHPSEPDPRILLAQRLIKAGNAAAALEVLSVVSRSTVPGVLLTRAEAYFELNRLQESKQDLIALSSMQPNVVGIHVQLARIYEALDDDAGYEHSIDRILALEPNLIWANQSKVQLLIDTGRFQQAKELMEFLGDGVETNDVRQLSLWAALARGEQDYDAEVDHSERLFHVRPSTSSLIALARAQQRTGSLGAAEDNLKKWLREHPNDLPIVLELANVYLGRKQFDRSIEAFRRVVSGDPNNLFALNNLAWYLRKSSPAEAKLFAEKAVELAPQEPAIIDTYAAVLESNGEFSRALEVLDAAIEYGQQTGGLRLRRVEVLLAIGDGAGASDELRRLQETAVSSSIRERAKARLAEIAP